MSQQYAQIADLNLYGISANAAAGFTTAQQNQALLAASAYADTKLAGRYPLPLVAPFDISIVRAVCWIAAYDLITTRGYDPASGSDINFRLRNQDAIKFFDDVERGNTHPVVTTANPPPPSFDAPQVWSSTQQQVGTNAPTPGLNQGSGSNRGW